MKKSLVFLVFLVFVSLSSAAPTLTPQSEEIQPGETFLASITTSGEFTKQLTGADIKFYEGRKKVFFESDITFYKGAFYLYVYTTREGNFTLEIQDILFKEGDELKEAEIKYPLNILTNIHSEENKTWTEILSIKPGFIFTTTTPSLKLINKGSVPINITFLEKEVSLGPFQIYDVKITPQDTFSLFKISSYKDFLIPIIYPSYNGTFVSPGKQYDLKYSPELVLTNIIIGSEASYIVNLFNFKDDNLTDFIISSDIPFIKVSPIENLSPRGTRNLTLTFSPETPGHVQGSLAISYTQSGEKNTISIPLNLFILPEGSLEGDFVESDETCEEKGGIVCADNELCSGLATFTKGPVYCCLESCIPAPKSPGDSGWNIGWVMGILIFVALGGGGYYLYARSKKTIPKSPTDKLKESSEGYAKRISGGIQRS